MNESLKELRPNRRLEDFPKIKIELNQIESRGSISDRKETSDPIVSFSKEVPNSLFKPMQKTLIQQR